MTTTLKPYPAYKDSGAPWLGEVPAHWDVRRLRNIAAMRVSSVDKHTKEGERGVRLCNYVDVYKNERITSRLRFMGATATEEEVSRYLLARGDVLITKDSESWNDIGVPALVEYTASDLVCGYHLALLRPRAHLLGGEFLLRAMQSRPVAYQCHVEATGVTRYGLSHAAIKSIWLPHPPLQEQSSIVRFLDHADRRIRRYIRAKQKLIKLLEEQKQAIIHDAVTGRIDVRTGRPYPAYKDSGVPWLGEVPAHWEVRRLRYLCEGRLTYGANAAASYVEPEWPRYLRITDFGRDGRLRQDTFRSLPPSIARDYLVEPGDILLARSGATVGKAFLVKPDAGDACHAGYLIRVRPRRVLVEPEFVFAFTQSAGFRRWKDSTFVIATIQNISAEKYADLAVPVPPLLEQQAIMACLKSTAGLNGSAIEGAMREVGLLREYRTRLIADVVTGKLDVREAAAALPDEAEEPEALDEVDELVEEEGVEELEASEPESDEVGI